MKNKLLAGLVCAALLLAAFPLTATAPDTFTFDQAKLRMVFRPEKMEMTLYQGGGKFEFTKD